MRHIPYPTTPYSTTPYSLPSLPYTAQTPPKPWVAHSTLPQRNYSTCFQAVTYFLQATTPP